MCKYISIYTYKYIKLPIGNLILNKYSCNNLIISKYIYIYIYIYIYMYIYIDIYIYTYIYIYIYIIYIYSQEYF